MSYEVFKVAVKAAIREFVGERYKEWELRELNRFKVNTRVEGFSLLPPGEDRNNLMVPLIYYNDFYKMFEFGYSFTEIMENIATVIDMTPDQPIRSDGEFNLGNFKEFVTFMLINREKNVEYLKELPHRSLPT